MCSTNAQSYLYVSTNIILLPCDTTHHALTMHVFNFLIDCLLYAVIKIFLVHLDSQNSYETFKFARMAIDPDINYTRYDVPRAGLKLFSRHSAQFKSQLADDYQVRELTTIDYCITWLLNIYQSRLRCSLLF